MRPRGKDVTGFVWKLERASEPYENKHRQFALIPPRLQQHWGIEVRPQLARQSPQAVIRSLRQSPAAPARKAGNSIIDMFTQWLCAAMRSTKSLEEFTRPIGGVWCGVIACICSVPRRNSRLKR